MAAITFMKFKNLIIPKDFQKEIVATVCYIYKIDKDGGAISKVYYYKHENGKFTRMQSDVSWLSTQLIQNKYVAFCGKEFDGSLINISKVIPMIKDDKPYLTTMVDDDKTNNLITLFDYYN